LEELGLDPGVVPSWQRVDDIWVRPPSGNSVCFPLPRGQGTYAAIARRADLDAALLDVARKSGVDVRDRHALTDARGVGDHVGFGIVRQDDTPVGHMKQLWPELLSRPQIREVLGPTATPEAPHRAWPIPARVDRIQLSAGRALFVGDAAAATDPMTGEGIAQALLTGRLAAAAVIRWGPSTPAD